MTSRCAPPWPPAAACGCCVRTPGNAWPPSSCPPPSRSSRSGRSSPCFASASASRWPSRPAGRPRLPSRPRPAWPAPPKPSCAPARWVSARPYLLATARLIAGGQFDLARLQQLPVEVARAELMNCPAWAEDRRLRPALRLRLPVRLPRGRLGDEGAAAALFPAPPGQAAAPASVRRRRISAPAPATRNSICSTTCGHAGAIQPCPSLLLLGSPECPRGQRPRRPPARSAVGRASLSGWRVRKRAGPECAVVRRGRLDAGRIRLVPLGLDESIGRI